MNEIKRLLGGLCLVLLSGTGQAQEPPFDCQASPAHRQFDFWLGEWEVRDAQGKLAGQNRISSIQRGCALREQWTSASGGTGESLNYYQPASGQWRQLWLDAGASIIDISGTLNEESMVLTGKIYYLKEAVNKAFRGSWTPLEDGRVRQFFEERDDTGEWQVWFDGYYSRQTTAGDQPGD